MCDVRRRTNAVFAEHFILKKKAINELESEIPRLTKFIVFNISIPVSEVIVQKRPIAIDEDDAAVGTTDKRMFIDSNGAPLGHKSCRKLLKPAIVAMCGPNFHKHFVNSTSPLMSQYLTSKVIDRIANSERMPWYSIINFNIMFCR
ncbi:hypothetical protein AVEN_64991-1 [Araneus ventricosus]|uniref:Uncharacterized protein n=1 Tax=Araneus ventricosus TaxID=182803 RepID=A0A4Y2UTW5_ARAVE|nr:hypothetical protein AVEN_241930-1 [Araneus ventricosus]GBO16441.1 hypothetical protein AVEN_64991-1 [Araneus ventricosus]